jgi:hypothetical protein
MRTQPTAQERPEALPRMDMHFTKAGAIFIASTCTSSMVHTLMTVAPGLQTGLKAGLVRLHQRTWNDGVLKTGRDGCLRHLGHPMDHHLTTARHHPNNWRSLLRPCPTTPSALESASTTSASLLLHHLRLPLMAGNHRGGVALHLVCQGHRGLFLTIPARSWAVICCLSRLFTAHSWAMCSCDTCSPRQSRHHIPTFSG